LKLPNKIRSFFYLKAIFCFVSLFFGFLYCFCFFFCLLLTFSFALMQKKKITKRKNQGCTFLPTPVLFSAKQKELASLKQLFVFNAPKSTSASRQKSEANS